MWESTAQTGYTGQRARVNHIPIFHVKMERCHNKTAGCFIVAPVTVNDPCPHPLLSLLTTTGVAYVKVRCVCGLKV